MEKTIESYSNSRRSQLALGLCDPLYTESQQTLKYMRVLANKSYDQMLDFGAGNSPYRELFQFKKYWRADVEQSTDGGIDFIIDPTSPRLELPDGSIDLIICMDVLEHVRNLPEVLQELKRVLSPQGQFVIKMPFVYREHEVPHDYRRLTEFGLQNELQNQGLQLKEIHKLGNAWSAAITIINERFVFGGGNIISRITSAGFRYMFLPLLNPLISRISHQGIYSSLFAIVSK